ncbi:response regulator [Anaeromyxobacter oryzisoli]|uniref:response regulator n=1 Tax=Anaeromyxobacter oryzisoli TaxID=2925408 RepID=UPI001F585742|nr:response regulator [Anaeromyxobacter sp. SG63]
MASAVAARPLRILVAEDDPAVARLYASFAERRGHAVVCARDGAEALAAAAAERPDVILLDVAMPRLDGRDALRSLKHDPATRGIPVLVLSALGGDQLMRDLLLELGAWDVLEKPVDLQLALDKAERLLQR